MRDDVKNQTVQLAFLGIALGSGLLTAAACSAPPFGWQGAGRIQGLPEQTGAPSDAGVDSGVLDAGIDTGLAEADIDAGFDAGLPTTKDAGMDSGAPKDADHSKDAPDDSPKG